MGGVRVSVDALKGEPPENISYVVSVSVYHSIIYEMIVLLKGLEAKGLELSPSEGVG